MHGRAVLRAGRAGVRGEFRQSAEGEIHLERSSLGTKFADAVDEIRRQIFGGCQLKKSPLRIQVAGDHLRGDLFAGRQRDAAGTAVLHQDFSNGGVGADLGSARARGIRDGVRDRAHATAREAPQAAMAVDSAHAVVQQNVSGAGRARAAVGSDNAVGR